MAALLCGRTIVLVQVGARIPIPIGRPDPGRAKPGTFALHLKLCSFCDEPGGYLCSSGETLRALEEDPTGVHPLGSR